MENGQNLSNNETLDEEAISESTSLLDNDQSSTNDEMDGPWPATFERSVSLLASPNMTPSFVEKCTQSPKIYPPIQNGQVRVSL